MTGNYWINNYLANGQRSAGTGGWAPAEYSAVDANLVAYALGRLAEQVSVGMWALPGEPKPRELAKMKIVNGDETRVLFEHDWTEAFTLILRQCGNSRHRHDAAQLLADGRRVVELLNEAKP